jgi:HEAT repeat protein
VKRSPVALEGLLAKSSSTHRSVLEAQFRAFGLDPRRSPTPEELLRKDRERSPLSAYPVTAGLMLRLLEIPPADLAGDEGHRTPKDIAACALVGAFTDPRKGIRDLAKGAAWMNISLKPAENELRRQLSDRRAAVRKNAAEHLFGQSPHVSAMFEHIDRQLADSATRQLAFNDLTHVVKGLFARLRGFVQGSSSDVVRTALGKVWRIGDELDGCRDAIMKAGSHPNAEVRHWAVVALKPMLRPHTSVDHLLLSRAFDRSTKTRTREEALYCLQNQGRPLDYWREWLLARFAMGTPRDRAQAVRLLTLIRDHRDLIGSVLQRATRDRHPAVRQAAAETLGQRDPGPEARKRLEALLEDRAEGVAVAAAGSLIPGVVTPRVRRILARGLKSRDVEVRMEVLVHIRRLGKGADFAFEAVRRCLRHRDINVSIRAIDALESMGKVDIPNVRKLAEGDVPIASRHARWVLSKASRQLPHAKVPAGPYIS